MKNGEHDERGSTGAKEHGDIYRLNPGSMLESSSLMEYDRSGIFLPYSPLRVLSALILYLKSLTL